LGLDPGERRVGVAVSDPGRVIATPHEVIDRRRTDAIRRVQELCAELDATTIVVGLPVSLSGAEGPAAHAARAFGAEVTSTTGIDVVYWDERYTTTTAESALLEGGTRRDRRRDVRDKVAAAVMLQAYLNATEITDE
jgi:putative Holliday junction resolvase